MDAWLWFGYWIITILGLLWVKRVARGSLRCNIFSAAIAAAIFVGINLGITYLVLTFYKQMSGTLILLSFLFIVFGLIPVASAITLFSGKMVIPFFKIETSDIVFCASYLTAWTFVALTVISFLQLLGFFLIKIFGSKTPCF